MNKLWQSGVMRSEKLRNGNYGSNEIRQYFLYMILGLPKYVGSDRLTSYLITVRWSDTNFPWSDVWDPDVLIRLERQGRTLRTSSPKYLEDKQ